MEFRDEFGELAISKVIRVVPKAESVNHQDELVIEGSYGSYVRAVWEVRKV